MKGCPEIGDVTFLCHPQLKNDVSIRPLIFRRSFQSSYEIDVFTKNHTFLDFYSRDNFFATELFTCGTFLKSEGVLVLEVDFN